MNGVSDGIKEALVRVGRKVDDDAGSRGDRCRHLDVQHDFFVVTPKHLRRDAAAGGMRLAMVRKFNYPPEVIPEKVRWIARLLERPMRVWPWAWQFVLRPE